MSKPSLYYWNSFEFSFWPAPLETTIGGHFNSIVTPGRQGTGTLGISHAYSVYDAGSVLLEEDPLFGFVLPYPIVVGLAIKLPAVVEGPFFSVGVKEYHTHIDPVTGLPVIDRIVPMLGLSIEANGLGGFTFRVGNHWAMTATGLYYANSWGHFQAKVSGKWVPPDPVTHTPAYFEGGVQEVRWNNVRVPLVRSDEAISMSGAWSGQTPADPGPFSFGNNYLGLTWRNGGQTVLYDDWFLASDFLGDVGMALVPPVGAGDSSQWTPSNTIGPNYTMVDDATADGDATYVEALAVNDPYYDLDLYQFDLSSLLAPASLILWVLHVQIAKTINSPEVGWYLISSACRIGGVNYGLSLPALIAPGDYNATVCYWDECPATHTPWTAADLASIQFGPLNDGVYLPLYWPYDCGVLLYPAPGWPR